jgi:hypothetical protein
VSLPDKPSKLIQLALSDLDWVETDPRYAVDMASWHMPLPANYPPKCLVCLAGAVMAHSLGAPPYAPLNPECYREGGICEKLMALDALRRGSLAVGLGFMQLRPPPEGVPNRYPVRAYEADPEGFKFDMRTVARILEEGGL